LTVPRVIQLRVCVIIPCFRVKAHIIDVIRHIPTSVSKIYVVDDCCPESSGKYVQENVEDLRVEVLFNDVNLGVGGALKTGYKKGLAEGFDIFIKIDGDGQMNPKLIPFFIDPIISKKADYTKGSRFHSLNSLEGMPTIRKLGNSILSLVNKFSSGYWDVMDPTNGFTAIHKTALGQLPLDKISNRYFFESDMLFRLGTIRAVVKDIPMDAVYADESSNLKVGEVIFEFVPLYIKAFFKRTMYCYFLRDFNVGTLEFIIGSLLFLFGLVFGGLNWFLSAENQEMASTGTVMIASIPIILGFQLLLSAFHFDIANVPKIVLQKIELQAGG
jgi:dolichol-phosphate mannosyltransferase